MNNPDNLSSDFEFFMLTSIKRAFFPPLTAMQCHALALLLACTLIITGCQTAPPPPSAQTRFIATAQQAQRGDANAQLQLAAFYSRGEGVGKNHPESARWLTLAAQQGKAAAQGILATMYNEGVGVPQDYSLAAHWARLAAMQGDSTGQSVLGTLYLEGRGVARDAQEAYAWFALAATQGDAWETQQRDRTAAQLSARQLQQAQHRATALSQQIAARQAH